MISNPISDISKVHVVYAEDSPVMHETVKAGLRHGLGIGDENMHHFETVDQASEYFDSSPREQPTVVILDNHTPGWLGGFELASQILQHQEEHPNVLVVAISSSDLSYLYMDNGLKIKDLQKAGGEFWSKQHERHLVIPWIADYLREGRVIPRAAWMTGCGLESRYRKSYERELPIEKGLSDLFDTINDIELHGSSGTPDGVLSKHGLVRGDFFRLGGRQSLEKLGLPPRSIEGPAGSRKEAVR